jgi:signal transduction histidine kinase
MASIVDGFVALGELSGDSIWAGILQKRIAVILTDKAADITGKLAGAYLEAESEILRRQAGKLRQEDVRARIKPAFAAVAGEYPEFQMVFLAEERQFFEIHNALTREFAEELRRFFGRALTDRIVRTSLAESRWSDVKVDLEHGVVFDPMRFRNLQDCADAAYQMLGHWYATGHALLGTFQLRRAFERAYLRAEARYGFLPTIKNVLGATPLDVLEEQKAKRIHELEMRTSVQERDIQTADADIRRQAGHLQLTVTELEETKAKLEIAMKARLEFIDVVAHQFRTPLSAIRWNAELLSDDLSKKEGVDPVHKEAIEGARFKSVYLIETLDRVFATLDIDSGSMVIDKKPCFLWEVVQDVYLRYERDIRKKDLKWKFNRSKEQLKEVPFDKAKITAVLKILVSNAIMYSEDGGKVTVDVKNEKMNGVEHQVCWVTDEGLGVEKQDLPKIFEKFFRSQSAIHKIADGTGLGMYIAKHYVEAHQGAIWAESDGPGKGTTVGFALPVK